MEINKIYWLAGILDGEGCFRFNGTPHIQLLMTDLDIVERVRSITGTISQIYSRDRSDNLKRQYHLHINGKKAIEWMMTLYPIMSVRRKEKIREVISQWKDMRNRISDDFCSKGHKLVRGNVVIDGGTIRCRICRKLYNSRYIRRRRAA
jgi:hypothetical protein